MDRFSSKVSEQEVDILCDASKNKNTTHSTNTWINIFVKWADWRKFPNEIEKYSPEELDKILCMFYSEIIMFDYLLDKGLPAYTYDY